MLHLSILTCVIVSMVTSGCHGSTPVAVTLDVGDTVVHRVPDDFLSVALDCDLIFHKWKRFDFGSRQLMTLARGLSPAFLRMGGTACDFMTFHPDDLYTKKHFTQFTMSGDDWIKLNKFSQSAGWKLVFDMNVLKRNSEGSWDSSNAQELLNFNQKLGYHPDFELGNEPNAFHRIANVTIPASVLAKDFQTFRAMLQNSTYYKHSKLVGPDSSSPHHIRPGELGIMPVKYLKGFLQGAAGAVDVVTWHQYDLNGHIAVAADFVNASVLNVLPKQIAIIESIVNKYKPGAEICIGETASAYGGGAKGLSDKYIAGFLWLNKLGVAAQQGISRVMRQSFYSGSYGLLDDDLYPRPDYWLSLLYKSLVGGKVLQIKVITASQNVRFYAHCTARSAGSITLFGLNVEPERSVTIKLTGKLALLKGYEYLLEPADGDLLSGNVMLNGKVLEMLDETTFPSLDGRLLPANSTITLPPRTFAFYRIPGTAFKSC